MAEFGEGPPPESYAALAELLLGAYSPPLMKTVIEGTLLRDQMLALPVRHALAMRTPEEVQDKSRALRSSGAGRGMLFQTGANLLSNIGDMALSEHKARLAIHQAQWGDRAIPGLDTNVPPFTEQAAELRGMARDAAMRQSEMMPEDPDLLEKILAGVGSFPGMFAEVLPAGLAGLPGMAALFANKASRDESGEFTGFWPTAQGAAEGVYMFGVGKFAGQFQSASSRLAVAGTGFGALEAAHGGDTTDIAAAAALGAGLQATMPTPGKRHLYWDIIQNERTRAENPKLARAFDRQAEERMESMKHEEPMKPMQGPEKPPAMLLAELRERQRERGLSEADILLAEEQAILRNDAERHPERITQDGIPVDEGHPAVAIPGNTVTAWQAELLRNSPNPDTPMGKALNGINLDALAPGDFPGTVARLGQIIDQNGGTQGFWLSYGPDSPGKPRSVAESFGQGARELDRLLGRSAEDVMAEAKSGRGRNSKDTAALLAYFQLRQAKLAQSVAAIRQQQRDGDSSPEQLAHFLEEATLYSAATHEALANRSEAGRALNLLKQDKIGKAREAAIEGELRSRGITKEDFLNPEKLVEKFGGRAEVEEFVDIVARLQDPAVVAAMMRQTTDAANRGAGWKMVDCWLASLLSAPPTHAANMKSNALMSGVFHAIEQPVAVGIGLAKLPFKAPANMARDSVKLSRLKKELKSAEEAKAISERSVPGAGLKPEWIAKVKADRTARVEVLSEQVKNFKRTKVTDRVYAQEAAAELYGALQSTPWALEAVGKAYRSGEEFSVMGIKAGSPYEIASRANRGLWPFRLLTAEDAFFKAQAYSGRLHGLGMREAIERGVPFKARHKYVQDFVREAHTPVKGNMPNGELSLDQISRHNQMRAYRLESMQRAAYLTFTNDLGKVGKALTKLSTSSPWMKPILPFVKTPINVTMAGIERTPGVFLFAPKNWADVKAGGVRRDQAVARSAVGSVFALSLWGAAMDGEITGASPINPEDEELWRSRGYRPFSHKQEYADGSTRMESYARHMPLAMPMGLVATMADWHRRGYISDKDVGEQMEMVGAALGEIIFNQTVLQGPSRAMAAAGDSEKSFAPWAQGLAGSLVPAGINWMARVDDPRMRDQTGLIEALQARIPNARESLPAKHDLVGRPVFIGKEGDPILRRALGEYNQALAPHPLLNAMAIVGAGIKRVGLSIPIRLEDFGRYDDPNILRFANLDQPLSLEMNPAQREYVNMKSNQEATDILMNLYDVPSSMEAAKEIPYESLSSLRDGRFPQEVIDEYEMAGLERALVHRAIRDTIRKTYGAARKKYKRQVVAKWFKEGKVMAKVMDEEERQDRRYETRRRQEEGGL